MDLPPEDAITVVREVTGHPEFSLYHLSAAAPPPSPPPKSPPTRRLPHHTRDGCHAMTCHMTLAASDVATDASLASPPTSSPP